MGKRKPIRKIVREVINDWDPMGLLETGAPDDEYEPEIKDITRFIYRHKKEVLVCFDFLAGEINKIWHMWFDQPCEECSEIADEIVSMIKGEG